MQMRKLSCAEVPYDTYCNLAYYLNKIDHPQAQEYFEKGLNEINSNDDSSIITGVSKLINYAAYHNPEQALRLFEKYAHWQLNSEDNINFTVALNFLPLFKQDRIIKLPALNPRLPFYKPEGEYRSRDLYEYYLETARKVGDAFDQRNRTDNYKKRIAAEL